MTRPLRLRPAPRPPDLTLPQILGWADAFQARFGRWPTRKAGRVGLTGNTWSGVNACLKGGHRGLPPDSSLAKVLLEHRGRRHRGLLPPLTPELILGWADAHHARTGDWPTQDAGPVVDAPGETWSGVDCALNEGCRSLPGGSSIARLLELRRGVRNHLNLPPLVPEQILAWADAHRARTGQWPRKDTDAGPIPEAPGEAWGAIDQALLVGVRGLLGGGSLARLLAEHRGVRNHMALPPPFTVERLLVWADAYYARTGAWPCRDTGAIPDTPGETWGAVEQTLTFGLRGLPGDDTLARLLARHRGKRNRKALPPLSLDQIRGWAKAHRRRTEEWPSRKGGPIPETPGETWTAVD
jgi:hypothetical protein